MYTQNSSGGAQGRTKIGYAHNQANAYSKCTLSKHMTVGRLRAPLGPEGVRKKVAGLAHPLWTDLIFWWSIILRNPAFLFELGIYFFVASLILFLQMINVSDTYSKHNSIHVLV